MNGLSIYQLKTSRKYTREDFDTDLRTVLRRSGCNGEKICFILDESNVLETSFLERMNTLLANGEVPGLFEGDEYAALMTACREGVQRQGLNLDSEDELYRWFSTEIVTNLHIIFTLNPPSTDLSNHAATSPALFNRCVLNWMGSWSGNALYQVAYSLTQRLSVDRESEKVVEREANFRHSLVNDMVLVHQSAVNFSTRGPQVTPGNYLEFVNQFVKIFREKTDDLEDQQRHFNVGLTKIKDTVIKVRELREGLAEKRQQLEAKSRQASDTLKRMVSDQNEAERKREVSIEIQSSLEIQEREIAERRELVLEDLALAEPAVKNALRNVSNIKRQQLVELRSMMNPPDAIKLTLEAVCILLGYHSSSWRDIQSTIRKDDFIGSIVSFDSETKMSAETRKILEHSFLSRPNFNYETANRASKACGPLLQWVEAQVTYATILERVGPLREEVQELEMAARDTQAKATAIVQMIDELEASIESYKDNYANLITETQEIKREMETIEKKVQRSIKLIESLSSERARWTESVKEFEDVNRCLPGDTLLSAAFVGYAGFHDQMARLQLISSWKEMLKTSGIPFTDHMEIENYLSSSAQHHEWHANSLPSDSLCIQNAVMLSRSSRYPLIVDPTGRAVKFLELQHEKSSDTRALSITSFLDDAYVKQLESSLRFGIPILIQDAEHLDPLLSQVLNQEYKRTGGRTLIELGKLEIDFSKNFKLFLITRDTRYAIPSHIASRTAIVNFTITKSSLELQAVNSVLRIERPDVESKRMALIELQGEYKVRLRQLEANLLQSLNALEGGILDENGNSDRVMDTLEKLKLETSEIAEKSLETDNIMSTVEAVIDQYKSLARHCGTIFSILEKLSSLNGFYQFSLEYFLNIFSYVLEANGGPQTGETTENRVEFLIQRLYKETYRRTSVALLSKDQPVLSLILLMAKAGLVHKNSISMLKPFEDIESKSPGVLVEALNGLGLEEKVDFEKIMQHNLDGVVDFDSLKELDIWNSTSNETPILEAFVYKIFRPDLFMTLISKMRLKQFGDSITGQSMDLEAIIMSEVKCTTPIGLCSAAGSDSTLRIELLSSKLDIKCEILAMGSMEGYLLADRAIEQAAKAGTWVLIQNIHLAPVWLDNLEKRLASKSLHPKFRFLYSTQVTASIPTTLLLSSRILMFEPSPGIRSGLMGTFAEFTLERISKPPIEKARLYLLLAWVHAVLIERTRYMPVGWTKNYDFNDSDFESGIFVIDKWIDQVSKGRTNFSPSNIPWDALQDLLCDVIYGGKVDRVEDAETLRHIVHSAFTERAYDVGFSLTENGALTVPEGSSAESLLKWIEALPEQQPCSWLGLPDDAEQAKLIYGEVESLNGHDVVRAHKLDSFTNRISARSQLKSFQ